MLKVVIVEDQEKTRDTIKYQLAGMFDDIKVVGEAGGLAEAEKVLQNADPDLVFLDVELADGTSFTLLKKIPNPRFRIIFITAHDKYAITAIKFSALDFLLKPIDRLELKEAVEKYYQIQIPEYKQKLKNLVHNMETGPVGTHKIALSSATEIEFAEISTIIRLEGEKNYTTFFLDSRKKITVTRTLKDFEEMLEGFGFFRIHQSHIINLAHLHKYVKGKGGHVIMDDGASVEVSVRRKESLMASLGIK